MTDDDKTPEDATAEGGGSTERLRWILLGLVALVSLAAVISAFNPSPHNGGDNAGYVSLAWSLASQGSYTELWDPAAPAHTKYPPVFPLLLAALMGMGAKTWGALKTVAAVSTVGAAAVTYVWAQERMRMEWAAGVALVMALSQAVVYYSHWILSDPTFLLLTLVGLWALERADDEDAASHWLVLGVAAAGLAYFTRSAGLPLLVALGGWLALRRRWRALAVSAVALGLPALLWWLRARAAGDVQYVAEFWMVDPYQPALGTVGVGGLFARAVGNLGAYVGTHIPSGIVGGGGAPVGVLGVVLVGAAVYGWVRQILREVGPTELFFPLYGGLILLWPEVWSGDRFALPFFPVLLLYAAQTLHREARRMGSTARAVSGLVALAVLLLPAGKAWSEQARQASACTVAVRGGGAWACYGSRMTQFAAAAAWSGANLPEGSVVMTRKPRIFYVLSGLPSRTFPFDRDPAVHLARADVLGARHVLLDQVDNLATHYLGGAIQRYPGAFCAVRGFGQGSGVGTQLLGVLPQADRGRGGTAPDATQVRIQGCPASYVRPGVSPREAYSPPTSSRIPLLDATEP